MALVSAILVASLVASCSDSSTAPNTGAGSGTGSAGGNPPAGGGSAAVPATAAVTVGDIVFKSVRNGSSDQAVDTVAVGGTVTWTWAANENLPHSVQSLGPPSFASSAIQTGAGKTYTVKFPTAGAYQYDCAVHGRLMTGTIVVK
jgi:plastocyanin